MKDTNPNRNRSIYILPNLFTTGSLLAAFFAIITAFNHNFILASVLIFISAILDSLDGRVARMTNTQSAFGAEYDSLADIVAFGVAPALIVYFWVLKDVHSLGWVVSFLFLACVGLRLARFNTQLDDDSPDAKRYFTGLPCPAAAATLAGFVWFGSTSALVHHPQIKAVLAIIITIYLALMMVSNFKFRSFKDYDIKGGVKFSHVVVAVFILAVLFIAPERTLFFVFMGYALSGAVGYFCRKKCQKRTSAASEPSKDSTPTD